MYKKIHRSLSFIFSGIASAILIIMSVSYLAMSEKELYDNNLLAFKNDMNTLISNMEQQSVMTNEWLSKIASSEKYKMMLYDNDTLLSFSALNLTKEDTLLAAQAKKYYESNNSPILRANDYNSRHEEFSYNAGKKLGNYFVCLAKVYYQSGDLDVTILYSTESLFQQIHLQRLRFICIDLSGILLLFLFSWFYTKKLLSPIQKAREEQTAFISAASHELRTPLAVILSSISASRAPDIDEPTREQFLNTIESEGNRMSVLVSDMLTLARADSSSWSFTFAPAEMDTLLLNSYEAFLPLTAKENISMKINLPDKDIPLCHCDKERITQVLAILISNAISYHAPNADSYILLELSYHNYAFTISVKDNGIGISDKDKQHIFDRFYRADSSRSTKEHFGLGLCIAKEIIETHHGSISVKDTPGGGTTFTIKLVE